MRKVTQEICKKNGTILLVWGYSMNVMELYELKINQYAQHCIGHFSQCNKEKNKI